MYISKGTVKKILKEAGASRVSDEAASELQKRLNRQAFVIAQKAAKLAAHAKRKTVTDSDIKLAYS
ncbi:NFYB/HAP3 family transcription factor subunit [Candidatus Marsarchaeota archaeon]|jgi:histone H3/H4|nr:NFYB/HAP3 family transcription factor subunit [Candidatus Marsarchaeota archaeon]